MLDKVQRYANDSYYAPGWWINVFVHLWKENEDCIMLVCLKGNLPKKVTLTATLNLLNQYAITRQTSYWYTKGSGEQVNHNIKTQVRDQYIIHTITVAAQILIFQTITQEVNFYQSTYSKIGLKYWEERSIIIIILFCVFSIGLFHRIALCFIIPQNRAVEDYGQLQLCHHQLVFIMKMFPGLVVNRTP